MQRFNLASGDETQFVYGVYASGSMFDTLGVPAMLGRTYDRSGRLEGLNWVMAAACIKT
jgi:hypothetical protein